jgi:hypothetical protein
MNFVASSLLIAAAALAAAACNADSKAATPPTPALAKTAPAPGPAAAPALASGESFVDGARVEWSAGEARLVRRGDRLIVRIYTKAGRTVDALTTDDADQVSLRLAGANLALETERLVGRVAEAGALSEYEAALIGWSDAADDATLLQRWSCDETTGAICDKPVWLDGKTLAAVPQETVAAVQALTATPKLDETQGRKTASAWLAAAFAHDTKATGALMTDEVTMATIAAGFYIHAICSEVPKPLPRATAADCAIAILNAADAKLARKLRSTPNRPEDLPAGPDARVYQASHGGSQTATIVVELVAGAPRVTAASIEVTAE